MHIAIALIVNNRAQRVTATLITQTLQDHRSGKILEEPLTHPPPLQWWWKRQSGHRQCAAAATVGAGLEAEVASYPLLSPGHQPACLPAIPSNGPTSKRCPPSHWYVMFTENISFSHFDRYVFISRPYLLLLVRITFGRAWHLFSFMVLKPNKLKPRSMQLPCNLLECNLRDSYSSKK